MKMSDEYKFDTKEEFLEKLEKLVQSGVQARSITTLTPFHVHEAEHIMESKPSELRFFTLVGAVAGFLLSFVFIIYTVLDWPLITGGKPLVSIPAFIIIAFECTILIGGIVSLLGFLHLNRLPNIKRVIEPRECGSQFIIIYNSAAEVTENTEGMAPPTC
jgi:molybdopterin-containing oxidoreductase family membrane subunit